MDWYNPDEKLPQTIVGKTLQRCLALCNVYKESVGCWTGIVEVYFSPYIGWRRCETDEMIEIVKWTYWDNLNIQEK